MPTSQPHEHTFYQEESDKVSMVRVSRKWTLYLGCHEFRGTTESTCRRPIPHVFLAETIIGNLDVSVKGKKDIVEFQVTIDDAVFMEVFEREADFRSIESVVVRLLESASIENTY